MENTEIQEQEKEIRESHLLESTKDICLACLHNGYIIGLREGVGQVNDIYAQKLEL